MHLHHVVTESAGHPLDLWVFDHHRAAFPLWCRAAAKLPRPPVLLSFDRHFDLALPPAAVPSFRSPEPALDAFARDDLGASNDQQILAAVKAGALDAVILFARSPTTREPPPEQYADRCGALHPIARSPAPERMTDPQRTLLERVVAEKRPVILDIDLDCFTTLSDADPFEVVRWSREQIAAFLLGPSLLPLWPRLIAQTCCVTLAREPYHCGGLGATARLWLDFAEVFFERLLGVPAP